MRACSWLIFFYLLSFFFSLKFPPSEISVVTELNCLSYNRERPLFLLHLRAGERYSTKFLETDFGFSFEKSVYLNVSVCPSSLTLSLPLSHTHTHTHTQHTLVWHYFKPRFTLIVDIYTEVFGLINFKYEKETWLIISKNGCNWMS